MGLSSTTNRAVYAGDGSSTIFSFPYYFFAPADLQVFLYDTGSSIVQPQTLNTHYTVSGNVNLQGVYPNGGNVVMNSSFPSNLQIVVTRSPSPVQNYVLTQNGQINAVALVQQFDYLTGLVQRLQDEVSRAIQLPDGLGTINGTTFNQTLPQSTPLPSMGGAPLVLNSGATGWSYGLVATGSGAVSYYGILPTSNGGTGLGTITAHALLVGAGSSTIVPLSTGTAGQVLQSNGSTLDPSWLSIIPVSSGGTGSGSSLVNGRMLQSVGGTFAESPVTISGSSVTFPGDVFHNKGAGLVFNGSTGAVTLRAGSSITPYTLVLPAALGGANTFLQTDINGQLTFAAAAGTALNLTTKTSNYNAAASDDILIAASGVSTVNLYGPSGNSGKVLRIKNTSTGAILVAGSAATIDGTSIILAQQYAGAELMCDGSNWSVNKFIPRGSTRTILSSSGTYTTPFGATSLWIRQCGGGGGGGGTGTAGGGNGGSGGTTIFGSSTLSILIAGGGAGGASSGNGGTGGSSFVGVNASGIPLTGGFGSDNSGSLNVAGGPGGSNFFGGGGGGGGPGSAGRSGAPTTGGGGGGAGGSNTTFPSSGGGGAGGGLDALLTYPLAVSYVYQVGDKGALGAAGTSGAAGGSGGTGTIIIEERYS